MMIRFRLSQQVQKGVQLRFGSGVEAVVGISESLNPKGTRGRSQRDSFTRFATWGHGQPVALGFTLRLWTMGMCGAPSL